MSREASAPASRGSARPYHWILSGIGAVLMLHLIGFLLNRALVFAQSVSSDVSPHIIISVLAVQFTGFVAWVFLPFALLLFWRATRKGTNPLGAAALIGVTLPALSWARVGPALQLLIPAMIATSIATGMVIGLFTWLILSTWVPNAFQRMDSSSKDG